MNSFKVTAIGTLARNPDLSVNGKIAFARFCLVGSDTISEGPGEVPDREVVTSLWFIAFGDVAADIAQNTRKGDQLIVEANIITHRWMEDGQRQKGHTVVATDYRLGARRGDNGPAAGSHGAVPPGEPPADAAHVEPDPVPQELAEAAVAH